MGLIWTAHDLPKINHEFIQFPLELYADAHYAAIIDTSNDKCVQIRKPLREITDLELGLMVATIRST